MRHVLGATALAVSAVISVSACGGSTLSGTGSAVAASSASTPTSFPSTTSSVTPSPITSSSPTPTPSTTTPTSAAPPPATRDIKDIHYRKPPGFVYGNTYRLNNPGEKSFTARFMVPSGTRPGSANPDVIALVLYRLPSDVRVVSPQEQLARVRYYNRMSHATTQSGLHQGVIAGYPAIQENAIEQSAQTTYRYAAWFVFGTHHVVLVSCQVHSKVTRIANGCQSLLSSIRFTG